MIEFLPGSRYPQSDVEQKVILITDGKSQTDAKEEADVLKNTIGATLFGIGIGKTPTIYYYYYSNC